MAEEKVLTVALSKIAAELAEKHEMSKKGMGELLANFVELTVKNLKKGNKVRITGLGIFQVRKRLARMGHRVATNYRDEAKARKWQEQARAEGLEILIVPGDVANPESAAAMVDAVRSALGPVDILVNNAGITRDTTIHRMSAL